MDRRQIRDPYPALLVWAMFLASIVTIVGMGFTIVKGLSGNLEGAGATAIVAAIGFVGVCLCIRIGVAIDESP